MHFEIPFPENEIERLKSLIRYDVLDTLPDNELDAITELASYICKTPISLITLIDKERQWFKSKFGMDISQIDRNISFCQETIRRDDLYIVPDLSKDKLFANNPIVKNEHILFYAGYPLRSPEGYNIGTICVLDRVPKNLNADQKKSLETLSKAVIAQFELKKRNNDLQIELNNLINEKISQRDIDLKAYKYALDETSIVFITDPEGIITYVNEKQCEVTQYRKEELIGQNARILNSGYHSKDFFEQLWTTIERGITWKGEIRNKRKDGSLYWVETTIIPFRNNKNETYQYVAIRQDITDRKEREEKLKVYENIVKNMSAGIYVFKLDDTNGKTDFTLTASNLAAYKFTGINGPKVLGKKMSQILPDIMQTDIPEKFKNVALGGDNIFVGEFQYNNDSFKEEFFELSAFSLPNNSIGVSFDNITLRKNVEIELKKAKVVAEQSVITKDNFLANMSHEIRTPMNAIIGFTDILSKTNLDESQKESVSAIKSAGENLLEIINDILDFSKIESGKLKIENKPFNLRETLKKVIDLLTVKAREKSIGLNFNLEPNLPEVISGDKVRLTQIIVNLVGNAIKFTNDGDVNVNVKCKEENADKCTVQFSVKDTGIGISQDKLADIFERFIQASSSTTRKFGGTGLGLSIVKNLIELQGGSINVISELGKGSEFIFELSYPKVKGTAVEKIDESKLLHNSESKVRILLFEDNLLNQKLATMVLKGFGFDVELAGNGKIGVEKLKKQSYDCILMDLQMPEMDGYQATTVIRNELNLQIPIIAMTAHSLIGEKEKCLGFGMNEYITKPFKQEELFSKIINLISSGEKHESEEIESIIEPLSFNYLNELCGDDPAFKKEMIDLFLQEVPKDMALLENAIIEKKYENIKAIAHKLKSSVTIIGLSKVAEALLKTEIDALDNQNIIFIKREFQKIKKRIDEAYEELKSGQ